MNWSESDFLVEQMIKGSTGELWGVRLEDSDHFPVLKHSIESVGNSGTLLDVGCGAGDVSRVWTGDYIGVDLPWVVERVSKFCNPGKNYFSLDLNVSTVNSLPPCRVLLMNAFLDVRENPHELLDSVLQSNFESLVIHRQRLSQKESKVESRKSYGDSTVPSSIMSWERIHESVMTRNPSSHISLIHWQQDYYTLIVRR